jgi:hypothetical protein
MGDDVGVERTGGSRAVQGCLIGAVLLFVLLLAAMVFLAYARMRDRTAPEAEPTIAIWSPSARLAARSHPWSPADVANTRYAPRHRSDRASNE